MGKSTVAKAICRKFIVTMKDGDGAFSGLLTEMARDTLVFEQCQTVPAPDDVDPPQPIVGRVHVFVSNVAYLQEVP